MGVRYLYSILKEKGYSTNLIFFKHLWLSDAILPTELEYEKLLELLEALKVNMVGISVGCSSFFKIAVEITMRIKKRLGISLIWGGVHPTIQPEECIKIADFVCVGEGEYALLELISKLSKGESIENIENIWIRKKNGGVIRNNLGPLIQDLDSLPFPDYSNLNKYFIEKDKVLLVDPFSLYNLQYHIMASRGCPYFCSFCVESIHKKMYKGKGRVIRRRSVENVISELRNAREHLLGVRLIGFFDNVFSTDLDWVANFTKQYKQLVDIPFWCYFHPLMVREEILALLKDANIAFVNIGVQSGSERIRKNVFNRRDSNKDILEAVKKIQNQKIIPLLDFIIDNPFDRPEDKRQTLELLFNLARPFNLNLASLLFFPEYDITKKALKEKLISEKNIEGNSLKALSQMAVTIDYKRSRRELVFICFISLSARSFIPRLLIYFLAHKKNITKFPWFQLVIILTMVSGYIRWLDMGIKFFHRDNFNPLGIRKYWRYFKYVSKVVK